MQQAEYAGDLNVPKDLSVQVIADYYDLKQTLDCRKAVLNQPKIMLQANQATQPDNLNSTNPKRLLSPLHLHPQLPHQIYFFALHSKPQQPTCFKKDSNNTTLSICQIKKNSIKFRACTVVSH